MQIDDDPAIVADLIARSQASIEALKRDIRTKSGTDLLDFIQEDVQILKQSLTEPRSFGAIMAGMNAATWINAVIAREYGLPAVVSVENATRLIKDGQRIRVHGTDGYVEILA